MIRSFQIDASHHGQRLDLFLAETLEDVSRARVQQLIKQAQVLIGDSAVTKPSHILTIGDIVQVVGEVALAPVKAEAEKIPLKIMYEDEDLAVIDKPAGMMVHAGAGSTPAARSRGTLVNALLYHMQHLSKVGGELRPGIVHRLDRETSGLILVAKNDRAHRRLAEQFAGRTIHKTYLALVHGWPKKMEDTVDKPIGRDPRQRTRMSAKAPGGRTAVTHFRTLERLDTPYGKYSLLEVRIETGRTHQIRVHLTAIGHPVVGDVLYGARRELLSQHPRARSPHATGGKRPALTVERNFLHAAELRFLHPSTRKAMRFAAPLPPELKRLLLRLKG